MLTAAGPIEERVHFDSGIPPAVNNLLQAAVAQAADTTRAIELLQQARSEGPEVLAVHVALYKFYFYRGMTEQAEAVVQEALDTASRLGCFTADWQQLQLQQLGQAKPGSPARYYLYSLKALAFIRLRLQRHAEAMDILGQLRVLDPDNVVGWQVIQELALGMTEED